jgi:hypothetical protein
MIFMSIDHADLRRLARLFQLLERREWQLFHPLVCGSWLSRKKIAS